MSEQPPSQFGDERSAATVRMMASHLELADGFVLLLLLVPNAASARRARELLLNEPVAAGRVVDVLRDGRAEWASETELVRLWLSEARSPSRDPRLLARWLELAPLDDFDVGVGRSFLERLNEQRDAVIRLGVPWIISMTPESEVQFKLTAPDVYSMRSFRGTFSSKIGDNLAAAPFDDLLDYVRKSVPDLNAASAQVATIREQRLHATTASSQAMLTREEVIAITRVAEAHVLNGNVHKGQELFREALSLAPDAQMQLLVATSEANALLLIRQLDDKNLLALERVVALAEKERVTIGTTTAQSLILESLLTAGQLCAELNEVNAAEAYRARIEQHANGENPAFFARENNYLLCVMALATSAVEDALAYGFASVKEAQVLAEKTESDEDLLRLVAIALAVSRVCLTTGIDAANGGAAVALQMATIARDAGALLAKRPGESQAFVCAALLRIGEIALATGSLGACRKTLASLEGALVAGSGFESEQPVRTPVGVLSVLAQCIRWRLALAERSSDQVTIGAEHQRLVAVAVTLLDATASQRYAPELAKLLRATQGTTASPEVWLKIGEYVAECAPRARPFAAGLVVAVAALGYELAVAAQ